MIKKIIFNFICFFFLLSTEIFPSPSGRVLVLNSYYPDNKWSDDTIEGIKSIFKSYPTGHLSYEYMDTKRASGNIYYKHLYDIFNIKYSKTHFDLIICTDNDALNFLKIYRDKLFPKTPVVFCGINNFTPDDIKGFNNVTGVNEQTDIKGTIDIAIKLQPEVSKLLIINDVTETGKRLEKSITEAAEFYKRKIEFVFLKGNLAEIYKNVTEAREGTAILFTVFAKDTDNIHYYYNEIILNLKNIAHVPIYGLWDFQLGYGLTGGKLASGFYQGKTAAELALKILNGESAENIPVVITSPNKYMFDYNELKRFDIKQTAIPADSIIINSKPGMYEFYDVHKGALLLITSIFILTVLSLLITILLQEKKNRKKTMVTERILRSILNSITESIFLVKPDGTLIEANDEAKNRLNISEVVPGEINIFDNFPEDLSKRRMEYMKCAVGTAMPISFTDERQGLVLLNNIYPITNEYNIVDMLSISSSDITFIKQNEELLNNIIANAPMGIVYITTNGSIILANNVAESILYLTKNETTGFYEKIKESPSIPFIADNTLGWPLTDVLHSGKPIFNAECIIDRESNYKQYISLNIAPVRDTKEKISGLVVMIVDITDMSLMQKELSESKRKLTDILESINDGFFAISKEGIITYVNSQAEETWGLDAERLVGKPVVKIFKREYYKTIYDHFDQGLINNNLSQLEFFENISNKWFMLHFYPYSDGISIYFTDITYKKNLEFKLKEMALTDVLTGVMNRRAGISIIEKNILSTKRDNEPLTICFMDVDGLKHVNDTYGHNEGDRLLTDMCKILSSVFRGSDTICRLGGDEFLAILPGCGIEQTVIIKERIANSLKKANDVGDHDYPLEVSVGFALYPNDKNISAEEFIVLADEEMYKNKQAKKAQRIS